MIAENTLYNILHLNDGFTLLFDRVICFCYSESSIIVSRTFNALASLFAKRY